MNFLTLLPILIFTKSTFGIDRSQFFEVGKDTILSKDEAYVGTHLPNFKFFGNTFNRIFVGDNGILSFLEGIDYFISSCFDIQGSVDGSMLIAPFWSEVNPELGGLISYSVNSDVKSLEKVNTQLQAGFPRSKPHNMHWVFVATWLDVHPRGHNASNTHCRNTFQTILTSDGTRSYVIFYYETLNWISGKNFDGNCSEEAHGSATAGFYAGHKIHQGEIQLISPASCTREVRELASSSNVGQNGVWVFKVDKTLEVPKLHDIRKPRQIEYSDPKFPADGTCPKPKNDLCGSTTPCRKNIVDLVEYFVNFLKDFPIKCLGKQPGTGNPPKEPTDPPGYPPPDRTSSPRYPDDPDPITEPPNIPTKCDQVNDIGILLDSSGSIGDESYKLALAFVDKLASAFVEKSRIMMIYYGTAVRFQLELDNKWTPAEISEVIQTTPYLSEDTYTGKAIEVATEHMKKRKRDGVSQNLVILTDGDPTVPLAYAPIDAKEAGISIFAVGIGKQIKMQNLMSMTLQADRVTTVQSYEELDQKLRDVSRMICTV